MNSKLNVKNQIITTLLFSKEVELPISELHAGITTDTCFSTIAVTGDVAKEEVWIRPVDKHAPLATGSWEGIPKNVLPAPKVLEGLLGTAEYPRRHCTVRYDAGRDLREEYFELESGVIIDATLYILQGTAKVVAPCLKSFMQELYDDRRHGPQPVRYQKYYHECPVDQPVIDACKKYYRLTPEGK